MATVEELDERIEASRRQIARYEERKRALIAKEREQARKWRMSTVETIGEMVLAALGCEWKDVELTELQNRLASWACSIGDSGSPVVSEERTPAEAKRALDQYRKAQKQAKRSKGVAVENAEQVPDDEPSEQQEGPLQAPTGNDMYQTPQW